MPGKEKPGIKRGSKRIPLADIMVAGTEEDTNDGPGPLMNPPSAPEASVSSNQCPVCQKTFKSSRGVTSHRSSRNSTCKTGTIPKSSDKSTSRENKENERSSRNVLASLSTPELIRSVQDEPVIVIEDTPPSASTRAGIRRYIRAKEGDNSG